MFVARAGADDVEMSSETPPELRTTLRDGTPVLIRPVGPDDKHLLEVGMERLSPQSRYFRFFRPLGELPERVLRQFTEINHVDHVAWGALDMGAAEPQPVGVSRYVRLENEPDAAEVAVTVVDSHQGRGLGTLLLAVLAHRAVVNGISQFVAVVPRDNVRMLDVFTELGCSKVASVSSDLDIRVPLFADAARYPDTNAGAVFRRVFAELGEG